ncbi:Hypothetical predicted protein [Pelobates cultripes]|uniref:Chloride channel CLIC-like protein 1 n=1 Tax=Pelobates cultripes TaxID=61616 RepID=A0AAD1SKB2_PELCU|nr:Hypothetical predicted protein [Pelobates cultripes]
MKSPFSTWNFYSKISFAASIFCFIIFLSLRSWKQLDGDMKIISRRTSATRLEVRTALHHRLLDSCLHALYGLLVLSLFVSIPWEWVRLYQIEVAKKTTILSEGYSNSCYTDGLSFWRTIKVWLAWNFSWGSDACQDYYKALLVDPFWEVTPLMAISSAISRIVLHPVELTSHAIGRSIRNLMKEIPSQWQPLIFLLVPVVCVTFVVVAYFRRNQRTIITCQTPPINSKTNGTKRAIKPKTQETTMAKRLR